MIKENDETLDSISFPSVKILQREKGYRFSLDPVLLSDFFIKSHFKASRIADLGTGSGIIPILICTKKMNVSAVGIEIQESLSKLAEKNVKMNNLSERISIINDDLRIVRGKLLPEQYDAVIANPPFRESNSGRLNKISEKTIARHEIKCSLKDILKASFYLLKAGGALFMIYPPRRLSQIISEFKSNKFEPKIMRFVHSYADTDAVMMLIKAKKGGNSGLKILKPLYVYEKEKTYSAEMNEIYGINPKQ